MATDRDFRTAVAFVLQQEGGYVNDPRDPGGETKYGISKRQYPYLDILALTPAEAVEIYRTDYWQASGADQLDMPLAQVVLDTAVNMGVPKAKEFLADSGGKVAVYIGLRYARYEELAKMSPRYARFLDGWLARLRILAGAVSQPATTGAVLALLLLGLYVTRRG